MVLQPIRAGNRKTLNFSSRNYRASVTVSIQNTCVYLFSELRRRFLVCSLYCICIENGDANQLLDTDKVPHHGWWVILQQWNCGNSCDCNECRSEGCRCGNKDRVVSFLGWTLFSPPIFVSVANAYLIIPCILCSRQKLPFWSLFDDLPDEIYVSAVRWWIFFVKSLEFWTTLRFLWS